MLRSYRFLLLATILATFAHSGLASAQGRELTDLADRIAGGASLLANLRRANEFAAFHDAARDFEESVGERNRNRIARDWGKVREAFARVESMRISRDDRFQFLVTHLSEDVRAADRLVGGVASPGDPDPDGRPERLRLVSQEICIGESRRGTRPCPDRRSDVTFRLPRDAVVLREMVGEWRDFGGRSPIEVYLNDRLVYQTDVKDNWETDGKTLNMSIPRGSTITLRSTGDPIWIRKFEVEASRDESRGTRPWWEF